MTTALDTELLGGVEEALAEAGRDAVLVTYPSVSVDSVESTVDLGTPVEYAIRISPPQTVFDYRDAPLSVPRSAIQVLVRAKGLAVAPTRTTDDEARIRVGTVDYRILRVDQVTGGDVPCAWTVFLEA